MRTTARIAAAVMVVSLGGCLLFTSHGERWPCQTDNDCESGEKCGYDHYCMHPECVKDSDCGLEGSCSSGNICYYTACSASSSNVCHAYACNVSKQKCKDRCAVDADCVHGFTCVSTVCHLDCKTGAECPGDFACDGRQCI